MFTYTFSFQHNHAIMHFFKTISQMSIYEIRFMILFGIEMQKSTKSLQQFHTEHNKNIFFGSIMNLIFFEMIIFYLQFTVLFHIQRSTKICIKHPQNRCIIFSKKWCSDDMYVISSYN